MKRKALFWLILISLLGCAPKLVLDSADLNKKNASFKLEKLNAVTVACLPIRSTMGKPVVNNTVQAHLYPALGLKFPHIKFVQAKKIYSLLDNSGVENIKPKYSKLLGKYFAQGRFKEADLSLFKTIDIDYLVSVSLNSGLQDSPNAYLFLISMQVWQVEGGKMVWDATLEGSVLLPSEEDYKTLSQDLMKYLCDEMLARLSQAKKGEQL